jgi:hypothetical protein
VTLVSVNDGSLLPQPSDGSFKIVNLPQMEFTEFENLLFSADLVITENKVSIPWQRPSVRSSCPPS